MKEIVPLISTGSKGPMGLAHLPRLWLKMRLAAAGKLAQGYRAGEGGFDGMLLEALGISADAVTAFIGEAKPSYLDFEAWVREHADAGSLEPQAIDTINKRILSFPKPEPGRSQMLESLGLPKDDREWLGTELNDLDDWQGFHLALRDEA